MLNEQTISVPFTGGLDSKSDPKTVVPGDLTALENGVFTAANAVSKRNGYDAIPTAVTSGAGSIGASDNIAVYKPVPGVEELLQFGGNKIYSYSRGLQKWVDKGACHSIAQSVKPIARSYTYQESPDSAVSGNIEVHAWYDGNLGYVYISVIDNLTGTYHQSNQRLSTAIGAPKVIAINSTFYIVYPRATGLLVYRSISVSTPGTVSSDTNFIISLDATKPSFDVVQDGTNIWVAYNDSANIQVVKYSNAMVLVTSTTITEYPTNALSIVVNSNVFVYWHNGANGTRYAVLDSGLSSVKAPTTIEATTSPATTMITAYPLSTTSQLVFYTVTASSGINYFTKTATVSSAAVTSAAAVLVRSVALASKAFQIGSNQYFIGSFETPLQSTFYCFRSDGIAIARMLYTKAGGHRTNITTACPPLAAVNTLTSTKVQFSASEITKITPFDTAAGLVDRTKLGVDSLTLDFSPSNKFQTASLGANLHISGAMPLVFDGVSTVEQGFNVFPEGVSCVQGGSGHMADGIYRYRVIYEWIDAKGQIHRSAPSVATAITISGGGGNAKVTLTIPTLRITQKTSPRQEVGIQVYRTQASGSVYYNVNAGTLIPPTANDPTADTVTVVDTFNDSSIASGELLYTNGDILENIAAPPHTLIDVYQSRAVVAGIDDPLQFQYSKVWEPAEGVAFNDSLTLRCDPFGGEITAVKLMDDKIILFKERAIFFVSGDGPNDAGQGSTYGSPQLISSDVGCPYPKSVVLTPTGVMFMSYKGIYLLDRSLSVSYIGAKVEAYNSQNITAATLHNSKNQVRFLTDSGSTLVYDYLFQKWATFTNHTGVGAVIADSGKYHYLRTDGTVYEESTSFQDAGVSQYLKPVTGWLKLSGLQGFQRVRRFGILASYKSAHTLRVRVYYDYDDVNYDEYSFDASANIGSTSVPYQFRGHLKRQKCEAIKFEIQDTSSTGEAYSLADLTLEVGVKGGINRLKAAQSV